MNARDRIFRLIQDIELEPCRYKRMSKVAELRNLDKQLNQVRER